MGTIRIIPCLDVDDGRVVKGVKFVNLIDIGDPVEAAKAYVRAGADELVFLDISATNDGRPTTVDMVRKIAKELTIPFTVGGGIRTIEDVDVILKAGADKVSIGSSAVKNPAFINEIASKYGRPRLTAAIDAKKKAGGQGWDTYVRGGRENTGLDVIEWAVEVEKRGAGEILLTSMDRDGTQAGYDIELTKMVAEAVSIPVIASGGAGRLEDFSDVIIQGKASGVLAASLFHFGKVNIKDLKESLAGMGISVSTNI